MNVTFKTIEPKITVVQLEGRLDSTTAPTTEDLILPHAGPNCKILVDMRGVSYMSSAGLRMLLLLKRAIAQNDGQVVLAEVPNKLLDIMSMTGFLQFFTVHETLDSAIESLR
jgi:anti-sigma B factor antagonist